MASNLYERHRPSYETCSTLAKCKHCPTAVSEASITNKPWVLLHSYLSNITWTSWRLTLPTTALLFSLTKLRITGPLYWESTTYWWFTLAKGQLYAEHFHMMTSWLSSRHTPNAFLARTQAHGRQYFMFTIRLYITSIETETVRIDGNLIS